MVVLRAAWIVPIGAPPIRDGWVAISDGRVVAAGAPGARVQSGPPVRDLGSVAVLPGLVNAHMHLELSYLRGLVPPGRTLVDWVRSLIALRRADDERVAADCLEAARVAIAEAAACGTAVVGDISNSLATPALLEASALAAVVFYEQLRFNVSDAEELVRQACREIDRFSSAGSVRVSLAAHAPYSVAPLVLRAMRQAMDCRPFLPASIHVAESAEETQFIADGGGPWRELLEARGAWDPAWVPPGVSPVRYLDESGFLHGRLLAVHGVQMTDDDLRRVARHGATLVTCPRSNAYTGAGTPPIAAFYASGVRVAVGTDSLASVPDLDLFAELAEMRRIAPLVPAGVLLDSATRQGARALGFDAEYGTIEPGKRARLLVVDVPSRVTDVEEYLVSGAPSGRVGWIDA
jgi:aminodeoxyfutalosine deaminase